MSSSSLSDSSVSRARAVIDIEIQALNELKAQLDDAFNQAVQLMAKAEGRVMVTGMGKSGLIGRKIAATLSSTGTPAYFLHPAEGSHGDLGMLMKNDVVIAISYSGETPEILGILPVVKRFGVPLIGLTGNPNSTLAEQSDVVLSIAVSQEACPLGLAPTASTTVTLALGDALAVTLLQQHGFSEEDFAMFHPAGALGKRLLLRVKDIMHDGTALPVVQLDTPFLEALMEVSEKKLGLAVVVDDQGHLAGVLTDGDVRRALTRLASPSSVALSALKTHDIMTLNPKQVDAEALAVTALRTMETCQITALISCFPDGTPQGVVHLHDILKTGIS